MQVDRPDMGERDDPLAAVEATPDPLGRSVLVGLVGAGIQHSRTPRMHELEGTRLGLRYVYKLLDIEQLELAPDALPSLLDAARICGFAGLNVTHPFKQAILPLLDELSPEAAAIGAVNTVVFAGKRCIGHNTDCWGFAEGFRRGMEDARIGRVVLFGAGGAGTAVARALLDLGVGELLIHDTLADRAGALASALATEFGSHRVRAVTSPEAALTDADGLVNATPMGMAGYTGMPISADALRSDLWVADIVYFPLETELLRTARLRGCRTLSGAGMALYQAVRAFELFSGMRPDAEHMRRHFGAD